MSSFKIEDFKLLKIIGIGATATVFAAELNSNMYVIKAAKKEKARVTSFGITEKNVLMYIKHPFIATMLGCFTTDSRLCYILEYAPGGDMWYHLELNNLKMPVENVMFYGSEVAMAIGFLHSNGIVHRDIKLRNILIASDGHIKLTDFGSAAEQHLEGKRKSFVGTVNFVAPEVVRNALYSFEVDWYSLGICLYYMMYGKFPFDFLSCSSYYQKLDLIQNGEILYPDTIPESAISVLKGLLNKTPSQRLGCRGFNEIRDHEFFATIDWEKLERKEITPPFTPKVNSKTDFHYFDPDKRRDAYSLTKFSYAYIEPMRLFKEFDYVNPDWED